MAERMEFGDLKIKGMDRVVEAECSGVDNQKEDKVEGREMLEEDKRKEDRFLEDKEEPQELPLGEEYLADHIGMEVL